MSTWLWGIILIIAVVMAHWGAEKITDPLKKLTKQFGLSPVGGGALVGIAAASPEIAINGVSALNGVSAIGLGTALGSNIIAIPLMVMTAYFATRKKDIPEKKGDHKIHLRERFIRVDKKAITVQALPYIGLISVFGILTLPEQLRGLQASDGWILLGLYILFLAQAILRGRQKKEKIDWDNKELLISALGLLALAAGAYLTVRSTENLVKAFGISEIIGGLFITAPMAALPEVFATWNVTRSGEVSSGVTSVISDHAATITVAMFPIALVGVTVNDFNLFLTNFVFVLLVAMLYAMVIHFGKRNDKHGFLKSQVFLLGSVLPFYAIYVLLFVI